MKARIFVVVAALVAVNASFGADKKTKTLDIHWIDTEGGAATLIITPLGESILTDSGNPGERDAGRIASAARAAGLDRIDHVISTHWHLDHIGGLEKLAELLPLGKFYDRGIVALPGKDVRPQDIESYRRATRGKTTVLKAGDELVLKSAPDLPPLKLRIVAADGLVIGEAKNQIEPPCAKGHPAKPIDNSDNARSIGFVLSLGDFDFFNGGDLTWNIEHKLCCPRNIAGVVDVYQTDHHGLDESNNPALIEALSPTVAIMNNGARKGGEAGTCAILRRLLKPEAIFQVHRSVRIEAGLNAPAENIANDEEACAGHGLLLAVEPDGKAYTVRVPAKGTQRRFESKR